MRLVRMGKERRMTMAKDPREEKFLLIHEQVFGSHPTRNAIPHSVARDYLDFLWEVGRARAGVDNGLLAMSIPEIKARGMQAHKVTAKAEAIARMAAKGAKL